MSYNSTGLDLVKTNWIRDIMKTCKIDFFQLQEHFKTTKTLDSYFKKEFPTNDSYVMKAFREPFQDAGRAKGGLAQLASKQLDIKKEKIPSKSWRIQSQIVHIRNYKVIWFNCYFPTDPQTVQYDDGELVEVLNELEYILDNNEFDDCIIGGDLNYDSIRTSGFSRTVRNFMTRLGLSSVWEKFPVDFTHIHTDLKSTSILDNFLLNERLLDFVEDAGVLHLGDNLSRHSPVMVKLNLGAIPAKIERKEKPRPRRPDWYKATSEDINEYTNILDNQLKNLMYPESIFCSDVHCEDQEHCQDRDRHVLDILKSMIESSHVAIPLTKKVRSKESKPSIPGWKQQVEPFRQDSLFWHSVWLSADKPNTGHIYKLMCWSRNKYHYAIRKLSKQADTIKAENLLEASEQSEMDLLREMKRIKGSKGQSQTLPDEVDGETEADNILEKFKEVYEELYNSADTSPAMMTIKERLNNLISQGSIEEVNKITSDVVKKACTKMKPGKMDVSGGYSSDVLLHAPNSLFEHLAVVFRSFLTHGSVTGQLLCCAFLPLYKGGHKTATMTDSYRAITGS